MTQVKANEADQAAVDISEYYRVLWLPELERDWNQVPVPNSTHIFVPSEWINLWKQDKRGPNEFPLEVDFSGVKTILHRNALNAFLQIAATDGVTAIGDTEGNRRRCGELDGVCAFSHPKGAYEYAKVNQDSYPLTIATFRGEYVCDCHEGAGTSKPEARSYVVRVVEKLYRLKLPQFEQKYASKII